MSSEADKKVSDDLSLLYMSIEKQINNHLKEIEYENEKLIELRCIIILRDDSVFKEIIKYRKANKIIGMHLSMEFDAFKNGDEEKRKELIYDVILRSINISEEKGIENLEPVKEIINKSRDENIDEYIAYYKSIRVVC